MAAQIGTGMRLSTIDYAPWQLHVQLGSLMSPFFQSSAVKWLMSWSNCTCLPQQRLLQSFKCDEKLSEQLQGTPALIIPTIKAKLVKTLLANYAMWPLAHIINFKFIPSSQRILYINCVQVKISAEQ